jgi:uncharacterized protein (TIGR03435 family)
MPSIKDSVDAPRRTRFNLRAESDSFRWRLVMARVFLAITVVVGIVSVSVSVAQDAQLRFDVASVRPASSETATGQRLRPPSSGTVTAQRLRPGRVDIVNTSLRSLLMLAFGVKAPQVSGPSWLNTATFDIQATFPAEASRDDVLPMLRTLLSERFGLIARVEQRLVDGYELVVGDDRITIEVAEEIDELTRDFGSVTSDSIMETFDGPQRRMVLPQSVQLVTSRMLYSTGPGARLTQVIDAARITMPEFANLLALNLDRPVIDRTGLTGVYSFRVELDMPIALARTLRTVGTGGAVDGGPAVEPTGISTPKAIESLGLRLQEARVPLDFVEVQHVERAPTGN